MPTEKTIITYKFEELSQAVKEKLIKEQRECPFYSEHEFLEQKRTLDAIKEKYDFLDVKYSYENSDNNRLPF